MQNTSKLCTAMLCTLAPAFVNTQAVAQTAENTPAEKIEEVSIIAKRIFNDTQIVSPVSTIDEADLQRVSVITVEDAIAHAPSLVVRRRFIGDPNGVIGIRGANMFQGTHSMVFADGMPLHYHLQTRYSGSPRWSLISPSEIEKVDVVYGPFSAEYSGNAMGGVVNITSKTPDQQKIVIDGTLINQDYSVLGHQDNYAGYKTFISYQDKIDKLTFFASFNRLKNQSQPQSQYRSTFSEANPTQPEASQQNPEVTGAVKGLDEFAKPQLYYGHSGTEEATSDLVKFKLGYDFGQTQVRANLAYEQRQREENQHLNFVTDSAGNPIWDGTVSQNNQLFNIRGSNYQQRYQDRNSLLASFGISGLINQSDWAFDGFYSHFKILKDQEIRSGRNPQDPAYQSENTNFKGRLTEYDNTGWQIFDLKLGSESLFGNTAQRLSVGLHLDSYELNLISDDYNSITGEKATDETDGNKATGRTDSGGQAATMAAFFQYGYRLNRQWDLALGLRYEDWQTEQGYIGATALKNRAESAFSPKVSLGYFPTDKLSLRYSVARAVRFPIVEELYRNEDAIGGGSAFISDPSLNPEKGVFHNVSINQALDNGQLGLNLFYDVVEDVIFNQSTQSNSGTITTSLPSDEVATKGVEFSYQAEQLGGLPLHIKYNLSYIDAEITKNQLDPSIIGNAFPRLPKWRSNLVLAYQTSKTTEVSTNLRYASNAYSRLDNQDIAENVFGAQDDYLIAGIKGNWQLNSQLKLSLGVDNINNEKAYVYHPWPQRTFYLEGKYVFTAEQE
ncbi:TonB-dependent receptor [Catenovulum sediminis]|uniref:TonB-dependent receptor n=1 Tax=Catenovulum sediminis TaxID=1740262 RepID=A0ABV1RFQ0_9ALTE